MILAIFAIVGARSALKVLDVWRCSEHELRAKGVRHVGLFGSTMRDKAGPDSDIDIMIDLDPDLPLSVYGYVGIKLFIEDLFEGPVDAVDRNSLKPYVKPNAITV